MRSIFILLAIFLTTCGQDPSFRENVVRTERSVEDGSNSEAAYKRPSNSGQAQPHNYGEPIQTNTSAQSDNDDDTDLSDDVVYEPVSTAYPNPTPTPPSISSNPNQPEQSTQPTQPTQPQCDSRRGKTDVKLLSRSYRNRSGDPVQYRISTINCDGTRRPLTAKRIWFDFGAKVESIVPLHYEIQIGTWYKSGSMGYTNGADLFGNRGLTYAHWETDFPIDISRAPKNAEWLGLSIEMPDQNFDPYSHFGFAPVQKNLRTYLKYGDAAPVIVPIRLEE